MKKPKKVDMRLGAETLLFNKNGNKLHVGDKSNMMKISVIFLAQE